jgi:TFIIF-interacting CTD phosphatase-like protein
MKKLLILDIDETLIYATEEPLDRKAEFKVAQWYVYCRPYLSEFLQFCFDNFKVAIWTSADPNYAEAIVANTMLTIGTPEFVWARDRCTQGYSVEMREHYWIKDLKKVKRKGYSLEHVLIIDDSREKTERNYGNHISISEFIGNNNDNELKLLTDYLSTLINVDNVRKIEKRGWRNRVA